MLGERNEPSTRAAPTYTFPDIFRYSITATGDIARRVGRKNAINRSRTLHALYRLDTDPHCACALRASIFGLALAECGAFDRQRRGTGSESRIQIEFTLSDERRGASRCTGG